MNQSWPKWIYSSCSKHFDTLRQGVTLLFEGDDTQEGTQGKHEWAEFRCNGPHILELSKDNYRISVDINILITVAKGNTNVYRVHQIGGIFLVAFTDILVKKYGTDLADDSSLAFCLPLRRRGNTGIQYTYLGQIEQNTDIIQAVVSGRYEVELQE